MSQNIRPARDASRSIDAIRRGAEAGVAQVLTPSEALMLLDRLADVTCPACGAVVHVADHAEPVDATHDV